MQPQSEIIKKSKFRTQQQQQRLLQQQQLPTTPTTRNTTSTSATPSTPGGASAPAPSNETGATATGTGAAAFNQQDSHKRGGGPTAKVIKCKKPLCHFKFYLDICDHQLTKRIEDQIKYLGGTLEFFLTPSVTHFVTDKPITPSVPTNNNNKSNNNNSCPGTPQTPQTPQTPYSLENVDGSRTTNNGLVPGVPSKKPIRNSRADAILNRARRLSTAAISTTPTSATVANHRLSLAFDQAANTNNSTNTTPLKSIDNVVAPPPPYTVWSCEYALKFFKKVQHELKDYLVESSPKSSSQKSYTVEPISLKGGFIKIEALKRNYRPYYQLFKKPTGEWPKIELTREDGAFRLSPKKPTNTIANAANVTSPKEDQKEKVENEDTAAATANAATNTVANNLLKEVNMTRKSRSRSTQNLKKTQENDLIKSPANSQKSGVCKNQVPQKDSTDKQCGVCEICKIEYDALTIHLKTKDHEYFAKNSQNFIALDTLIHSSADVTKFLDENHKLELKTELEEMEVDQEELLNNDEVDPLDNDVANLQTVEANSQKSNNLNKAKSNVAQPKMCSPTLREKSKRSTKGKHSSEKFKNVSSAATHTKSPKTASPSKPTPSLMPLEISRTPAARKKQTGTSVTPAAISPPIRAMLPPNSLYKVETHTEVQCTPTKNRLGAGCGENNAVMASPSIIVKFKKVRHAELQLLNGEAENFMFPKKISDSSDLPTDIDRHTSSDRVQNTASIGTTSPSHSSHSDLPSAASDEENDEDFELSTKKKNLVNGGKKAIAKAKRKLPAPCKVVVTTTPVKLEGGRYTYPKTPPPKMTSNAAATTASSSKWSDGGGRQCFPKAPIQPFEQLKKSNDKRNSTIAVTTTLNVATTETTKIMFPEATRKSSRTATAIVTAATTSTRLMQAAVDAAKNKNKVQNSLAAAAAVSASKVSVSTKNSIETSRPKLPSILPKQQESVKMETIEKPKQKLSPAKKETKAIVGPAFRTKLRLSHSQSVESHVEDRMGENDTQCNTRKQRTSKTKHQTKCNTECDHEKEKENKEEVKKSITEDRIYGKRFRSVNGKNGIDDGVHEFDVDDDEDDDDITVDNDDENDEDYVHTMKPKAAQKKLTLWLPTSTKTVSQEPKVRRKRKTSSQLLVSSSNREERLARRQSRVIAQIKLELHTDLEREEEEQELIRSPKVEKILKSSPSKTFSKSPPTKLPAKTLAIKSPAKVPAKTLAKKTPEKPSKSPKKTADTTANKESPAKQELPSPTTASAAKNSSPIKQEKSSQSSSPSRLFDYSNSERLKKLRYAFERLPSSDLWYQVYQRQDNCQEKYFEYFGSTKYRKLPYELGPIPFDLSLHDAMGNKICCKLCQMKNEKETESKQKTGTSKELFIDLKPQNEPRTTPEEDDIICSSTSATATQLEHSKFLNTSTSDSTQQQHGYAHKHKKLHLLQRYRQEQQQEQQERLQRQKLEEEVQNSNNLRLFGGPHTDDIKTEDVTLDSVRSREERAGSTHSNISSCASSTGTYSKSKVIHKKLLSKSSAYMANLELPPRKSPREHASTLALVSCIIKQRQDSMSKPNSEIDEPPNTPNEEKSMDADVKVKEEQIDKALARLKTPPPQQAHKGLVRESPIPQSAPSVVNSPRTRSQAATPIEELRFATEISENVKRMRRGRNKYDYSPPFVARTGTARSSKNRDAIQKASQCLWGNGRHSTNAQRSITPAAVMKSKIRGRSTVLSNSSLQKVKKPRGRHRNPIASAVLTTDKNIVPVVRKTGTKKGVLEFEMNSTALEGLKKVAADYKNPKLLEWQIDKFLTRMCKDYDLSTEEFAINDSAATICTFPAQQQNHIEGETMGTISNNGNLRNYQVLPPVAPFVPPNSVMLNTPPATDCFSSDFDLYDLIQSDLDNKDSNENSENLSSKDRRSTNFSIFNSSHMQGYYRKRKNLKSNRTGWPKVPRKKAATRQQLKNNKIYFIHNINGANKDNEDENTVLGNADVVVKQEIEQEEELEDETTQDQTRESGVITPPDSENENNIASPKQRRGEDRSERDEQGEGDEDSQENINCQAYDEEEDVDEDEDNETMADSIEDELPDHPKAVDSDADVEEEEEDEEDKEREDDEEDEDETQEDTQDSRDCKKLVIKSKRCPMKSFPISNEYDEDSYEPREKRLKFLDDSTALSPVDKIPSQSVMNNNGAASTSTPTSTPFMRALRRTPLLNGSLGSCISPSEKAGDNSDIFTVSSDGLDTDLDLSNSHLQLRNTCGDDDNHLHLHNHHHHHHQQNHHPNSHQHQHDHATANSTPKRKFDISKYAPTNAASCAAEAATAAVKSLAISQFLKKEVRVQCRRLRAPFRRFRYRR